MNKLTVHNRQIIRDIPFEEYLEMSGVSYSWIKSNGVKFKPSDKMKLGSDVHAYMKGEPITCDINIVKPLAYVLRSSMKVIYDICEKEVSMFAEFEYDGFILHYKGRVDAIIVDNFIADYKVSKNIDETASYFGYKNQINGYMIAGNCHNAMLIGISPNEIDHETGMNKVRARPVEYSTKWWEQQVLIYGKPIKTYV